jgi:hemerythrin-like metal-binding protein
MLVMEGEVDLTIGQHLVETLGPGGFWGEGRLVSASNALCEAWAATDVTCQSIPGEVLAGIPIVQWGMQEAFERRLRGLRSGFRFAWTESFRVGVPLLDRQHRRLFALAGDLADAIAASGTIIGHDERKKELLGLAREHFGAEEKMLQKVRYPRLDAQRRAHAELLSLLERFAANDERRSRPRETSIVGYLKDWLIRHMLLEDLPYRPFLAGKEGRAEARKAGGARKPKQAAKKSVAARSRPKRAPEKPAPKKRARRVAKKAGAAPRRAKPSKTQRRSP